MGEGFAFVYQFCILLHISAMLMILIPFLYIVVVLPHYASRVPRGRGTMGYKMEEDFAFENQILV